MARQAAKRQAFVSPPSAVKRAQPSRPGQRRGVSDRASGLLIAAGFSALAWAACLWSVAAIIAMISPR